MSRANTADSTPPNIDIGTPYTPRRPAPLISISVNHPLATAARKIKNFLTHKQTLFATTFSIKITPIVAIVSLAGVVALFGGGITTAYNFGKTVEQKFLLTTPTPGAKVSPTPTPVPIIANVSKAGTIKATYSLPPSPSLTPSLSGVEGQSGSSSSSQTKPIITPSPHSTSSGQAILHYILVSRSGSITYLASTKVNLTTYLNLRVLITGSFDSSKNILSIAKSTDIEVLQ